MEKINAYKAEDGKIFVDKSDCYKHDTFIIMRDFYKHDDDCPPIEFIKWVIDNHIDVVRFLTDLQKDLINNNVK